MRAKCKRCKKITIHTEDGEIWCEDCEDLHDELPKCSGCGYISYAVLEVKDATQESLGADERQL